MIQKNVLIIDDDDAIVDATTLFLESKGYSVESLSNGENVLQYVTKANPDIILLDVLLGTADGRDIASLLKTNISTQHIPIILFSAFSGLEDEYQKSGADAFLAKPFEIDDLLHIIQQYAK